MQSPYKYSLFLAGCSVRSDFEKESEAMDRLRVWHCAEKFREVAKLCSSRIGLSSFTLMSVFPPVIALLWGSMAGSSLVSIRFFKPFRQSSKTASREGSSDRSILQGSVLTSVLTSGTHARDERYLRGHQRYAYEALVIKDMPIYWTEQFQKLKDYAGNRNFHGSLVYPIQLLSVDVLSSPPQGADTTWSLTAEKKVTCSGCSVNVTGVERKPFADVFFVLDCSRSTGQRAKVQLTVDEVDFGVQNCCTQNCPPTNQSCHKNCQTVFIRQMTIEVRPKSWAQDSNRLLVQPQHTAEVFALQRNSSLSFQIPFLYPRQASITHQTGNSVCNSAPAFGWSPGHKDAETNSVSWTWELHRFLNGRKLEFNKHTWDSRPLLGIRPSHTHIRPAGSSHSVEASWELEIQPHLDLTQLPLEWDVKVTLHTAVFQSSRSVPGYSVTMGPTMNFERLLAFS